MNEYHITGKGDPIYYLRYNDEMWKNFKDILALDNNIPYNPPITYNLVLKSTGNGSVTYDGTTAKNNTKTFTLNKGTSPAITFSSDDGYRIKSVKVNSTDVTSMVSNNQYIINIYFKIIYIFSYYLSR